MNENILDISKLNKIIKKTIDAINNSKNEIYDIAENARNECKKLEEELESLKLQVKEHIKMMENLDKELLESRKKLLLVNKNFEKYSQEDLKNAYEKADTLRVNMAVKKEQEQNLIRRRNELELRLKEALKTVEKAENLISQVGVAMGYLTKDLSELGSHLDNINSRQTMGLKIIQAQDEERKRVARDIHDGPAQSLTNVVLKAEICEKLIEIDKDKAKEELKALKTVVRDCLQDVRRIIYDLRPMSLDDLGLIPTLQRFISTYQEDTGININFKAFGNIPIIKQVITLTAFRLIQEALNNIKKHAQAKNVSIGLEITNKNLRIRVSDDGKGFNIEISKNIEKNHSSGFGLYSMKERVDILSGVFEISSEVGKGTTINITLPISEIEEE
jgi:two-component system sensor histidine kinase DegS